MAAAGFEILDAPGIDSPQAIGHLVGHVVDVVWTSTAANSTADATITNDDLGVTAIVGVGFIGDAGIDHAGTDTGTGLTLATLGALGIDIDISFGSGVTALDLDDTNIAAARIIVWCRP